MATKSISKMDEKTPIERSTTAESVYPIVAVSRLTNNGESSFDRRSIRRMMLFRRTSAS
jgi:hypothetical protein